MLVRNTLKSGSALQLVFALVVSMQGWSAAEAQTVTTPPVVVSGKGTSLDITPSGTPIVNIAAPGIGASYNSFSRLDVGPEGLIFNNSGGISQSVIAGQILGNPNLRPATSKGKTTYPTPANLIIAEVLNGSRSNLRGPIEIAGWKAGLVIANPAGITCDGCGFINVSRATLTTGVPTRDGYNRLTGFQVNGGSVDVQGRGMSGSTLDFFDIVTGTARINADIYAREILIAGGTGSFNYNSNTSTAGGSNAGQLAIDSSVLGGMYANRIRLLGTGAGMGVNLRGVVSALDRQVTIAADGNINLRRVDAGGDVTIVSRAGSVRAEELVSSGGATIINAATGITLADNQNAVDETTETVYIFRPADNAVYTELNVSDGEYCTGPVPTRAGTCEARSFSPIALAGASIDALGSVVLVSGRDIDLVKRGSISGDSVSLIANQDINIGGGAGIFANNLALNAVRDVNVRAVTAVRGSNQYTDLGRGLYRNTFLTRTEVTGAQLDAFGSLFVTAGRDVSLEAASVTADGVIGLTASRDISIGGIASTGTTTQSWKSSRNTIGSSTETVSNYDGTNIAAGTGLYINANEEFEATGSALRSEGAIDIRAGQGTAYIAGSDIAATGNVVLTGRDVVVTGSVNSSTFDETVRTVKRGFLSKRTSTSVTSNQIETVFASSISGNRVAIDATREIAVLDSDIAGDQAVDITAGGDITIGSIPTTSDYFSSTKVKKVGFSISSEGLFLGISKTSNVVDTTEVANIGSLIGAASGAVRISAGSGLAGSPGVGDLDIVGSRIAALDSVTLSGDTIDIVNNVNLTTTRTSFSSSSFGLTFSARSPAINAATSVVRLGDIATNTSNARIRAVSALAAGLAIKNGYDAASNIVDTLQSPSGGSLGITLEASLGYLRTTSTSLLADETIVASQVAGGDVLIFARGGASRSGISIYGSDVAATRDLSIFSNAGIDLSAAIETDRYSGETRSFGVSVSASVGLGLGKGYNKKAFQEPTITLGVTASDSRYNGVDITARSTIVGAGGTATINTLGLLNIDGSQVNANGVAIDAGALNIVSRQNTSSYLSRERSIGASISYQIGGAVSANANFAGGNSYGSFATVADQAGIRAGVGGFDIKVAGLTELKGGIIASTVAATANRLSTGTFRASSIANFEGYSVYSYNFGLGFGDIGFNSNTGQTTSNGSGVSLPGVGPVSFSLPTFLSASGSQSSATTSAIAAATILIGSGDAASLAALGGLSRDTSGAHSALTRQFTEAQRAEIAQGFDAARQLTNEVTVFFANRAAEQQRAEASAMAAGVRTTDGQPLREDRANLYRNEQGNLEAVNPAAQPFIDAATAARTSYGSGSFARIAATALSGAAGGNVNGSLGSFAQAAAVNALQSLAVTQVKSIADSFFDANGNPTVRSEAVRTSLQALVGCAGAAPTGNCASGALGAASSVVLNNLVTALLDPEERDANNNIIPRSLADQQARTALIATLTGAIAGALNVNAGVASTAGVIETENNELGSPRLRNAITLVNCLNGPAICNATSLIVLTTSVLGQIAIEAAGGDTALALECAITTGGGSRCEPRRVCRRLFGFGKTELCMFLDEGQRQPLS
jgi:filamentous hemagglutinin